MIRIDSTKKNEITVADRVLISNANKQIANSTVTATELGYVSGVTSSIQTQLGGKAPLASPSFTGSPTAPTQSQSDNSTKLATTAYVDLATSSVTAPDATTILKGIVQLAGDLGGTAASPTVPGLASKEATITATTTADYYRGDKSFQTLDTLAVTENTNLYFTNLRSQNAITGGASSIVTSNLTVSRALASDASGKVVVTSVTDTELGYVSGVTSSIQTQINSKLNLSGGTLTGSLTLNADPTVALHAASKQYVDNLVDGLKWKQSVRVATTVNGTFATSFEDGDTIDGVTLATNDRILIKNQTASEENGIYIVQATGSPIRSSDADTWDELVKAAVFVEEGTVGSNRGFVSNTIAGGTLDTTAITIVNFTVGTTYTADGNGIELSGTTFSIELDSTTLAKSVTGLKVASGGITNTEINASAAIDLTKLAATTIDRALISNASGIITVSSVTATELGYVSGVTSDIQTQINSKEPTFVTLSIAKGGTNSATALSNNRLMISSGSAIVEASAITGNRALASNASGIPVSTSVTDTEIGYVSGVTSGIQTQIDAIIAGSIINGIPQRLAAVSPAPSTNTTIYTVGVGNSVSNPSITIVNTTAGDVVISLSHEDSGTAFNLKNYLLRTVTLAARETRFIDLEGLAANNTLLADVDTAGVNFVLSGNLVTGTIPNVKLNAVNLAASTDTLILVNSNVNRISKGSILVCNRNATEVNIKLASINGNLIGDLTSSDWIIFDTLIPYETKVYDDVFALAFDKALVGNSNTSNVNFITYGVNV